jgi:FMN phosphatase YigB (HAD superfamily)
MTVTTIFFDLGDTLGTPVLSSPPIHLAGFNVFDFVPSLLAGLRSQGQRLGILSNTGDDPGALVDQVLADTGILELFDPALRIYSKDVGLRKDSPEIFRLAADRAGLAATPESCLFVGEDASERGFAAEAGMVVCPDPLLIQTTLKGGSNAKSS